MDAAETIAMIRDIAFLAILVVMLLVVVLVYFKVAAVLNLAKRTLEDIEGIASTVAEKVVGPAAAGTGVAFGAGKLAAFLLGVRRKRKEKGE